MTKGVVIVGLLAALAARAGEAEERLRDVDWSTSLPEAARVASDGSITVTSTSDEGLTVTLAEIRDPGITRPRYAVKGRVGYRDVGGTGYVEMWNVFADGSYFSRTLAEAGPMAALTGSSDWREIALLFDSTGATAPPEKLVINVVLPARGEVTLSPLVLVELDAGEWPFSAGTGASAGLWGGIVGALLGTVAGLLGWLGSRGKAKLLVLSGFRILMAAGAVALAAGLFAFFQGEAYAVYYPLLLLGTIALVVPAGVLPRLRTRYEEIELRRMSALDA